MISKSGIVRTGNSGIAGVVKGDAVGEMLGVAVDVEVGELVGVGEGEGSCVDVAVGIGVGVGDAAGALTVTNVAVEFISAPVLSVI